MRFTVKKKIVSSDMGGIRVHYSSLPSVVRPKFADTLHFPVNVTELSSQNCSDLLSRYTLLWTLVNQDVTQLKCELLRLQQAETDAVQVLFRKNPGINQIEKWRKDAVVAEEPAVASVRRQLNSVNQHLQKAGMYLENFDRYINALSRELTRKTHEMGLNRG